MCMGKGNRESATAKWKEKKKKSQGNLVCMLSHEEKEKNAWWVNLLLAC